MYKFAVSSGFVFKISIPRHYQVQVIQVLQAALHKDSPCGKLVWLLISNADMHVIDLYIFVSVKRCS